MKITHSATANVNIIPKGYAQRLNQLIRFLRVARSGTDDTLLSPASHLKDAKAILYRPKGNLSDGKWEIASEHETVDMAGGWYDAADYIKFTLTTAYTTYYLLRSYQEAPEYFTHSLSNSRFVDILDEAKHGLDYLSKTHPSRNQFIIQVSTGDDHKIGYRLPHRDPRDGKREALSAISPAQMGMTAAALALGAEIFEQVGETSLARAYLAKAQAIYIRAREPDALTQVAFEKDATNDFYRDNNPSDNMGLGAIELYRSTNDSRYLADAKDYAMAAGAGNWAAWCCVTSALNYRLSNETRTAQKRLSDELLGYRNYDRNQGNIWGIPMRPTWAPLPGAAIAAAYSGLSLMAELSSDASLLWDNLDYYFGRNNWGVSFVALPELSRAAVNTYSQVYQLTGEYPLGAVSEGPGSRTTYEALKPFFKPHDSDEYFKAFNTPAQIFFDNPTNFQTMESTIVGQASAIYLLTIVEKLADTEIKQRAATHKKAT